MINESPNSVTHCPRCFSESCVKSGIIAQRQRFKCKACNYFFSVNKIGRKVDSYYIVKALQLYVEGVSYREIERILGVSHVSVMNWVKQYHISRPSHTEYHPTYKILRHQELVQYYQDPENLKGAGMIVTELGDKYMLIRWERFRSK